MLGPSIDRVTDEATRSHAGEPTKTLGKMKPLVPSQDLSGKIHQDEALSRLQSSLGKPEPAGEGTPLGPMSHSSDT